MPLDLWRELDTNASGEEVEEDVYGTLEQQESARASDLYLDTVRNASCSLHKEN